MPVLVTVCLVIVTVALVAIAAVAIRALSRMNRVLEELEEGAQILQSTATQMTATGREVQEFIVSVRGLVPPMRKAVDALGLVGERAADLSFAVLDEVERPVRKTMGLFRGVQAGASFFLNRLVHSGHGAKNGGNSDG